MASPGPIIRITNGAIIGFPVVVSSSRTNIKLTACLENAQVSAEDNPEIKIDIIKYENIQPINQNHRQAWPYSRPQITVCRMKLGQ